MAGNNSITGDQTVTFTDNLSFDGTERGGALDTDGQLWIGATASNRANNGGHVRKGLPTINANGNLAFGPGTITINPYNTAKWIVDQTANIGTHTTITAALAAASSGETIFIRPGTFTENLTLKAGVNLTAFSDSYTPNVTIVGKLSFSSAGTVTLSGIRLQTNGDNILAVTGSAASIVYLNECFLNVTNATGVSFTSSSSSATIRFTSCYGDITGAAQAFFASSSAGTFVWDYSFLDATGGVGTASTISAGILNIHFSKFNNIITTSGTAAGVIRHSRMLTSNSTCLTVGGSGSFICTSSFFQAGTASAISVGSTCTLESCVISSSNANAVTGAGTLTYCNLSMSTTSEINTTTQTPTYSQLGKWRAGGQPCFMATQNSSSTNDTGDGTVYTLGSTVDLTERFDQDSNFVPTTGTFTAPITGRYYLQMCALITGATTMTAYEADIITSNKTYACKMQNAALAVQQFGYPFPIVCDMDAADTATAVVFTTDGGGKIDDVFGDATKAFTYFCGFQIA